MAMIKKWRLRAVAAGVGVLAATGAFVGAGCSSADDAVSVECDSTRGYFAEFAWPVVQQNCAGCHNPQGAARETDYVLKGPADAGFLDHNIEVISKVASLQSNEHEGQSLFLLKPTATVAHEGGAVLQKDSTEYKTLLGLVVRLQNEDSCAPTTEGYYAGLEVLSPLDTLRKATIMLAARLPSADEKARVAEGGEAALEAVIDELMTEDKFYTEIVQRTFGDLFLTDFYLNNADDQIANGDYANPDWYENAPKTLLDQYGLLDADELRTYTNIGLSREPLALVEHVVRNDRPFSEIVTANYIMVTPLSAQTYGIADVTFDAGNDPLEYGEGQLSYPDPEGGAMLPFPHSGVLTSPIFLSRFPTTETNRNRHRARIVYKFFLGTDILQTAEQPLDQSEAEKASVNPTLFASQCTVCHARVDPIAGTFQAFDQDGVWDPSPQWYTDMFPPGFGEAELPPAAFNYGVQWLGKQIAADDRFALSTVYNVYKGLTGQDALTAPGDFQDPLYAAKFNSFLAQANTFRAIADDFVASNQNFKVVVKGLVMSPYFRAKNSIALTPEQQATLAEVGMGHLLTPEQLHSKIIAVLGMPWMENRENPMLATRQRDPSDLGRYQLYYGGQDADEVTSRITAPNGLMASVAERMATQMACRGVPQDIYKADEDRLLLKFVDVAGSKVDPINLQPEDDNGIPISPAVAGIKQAIVNLHEHMLGEHLTIDHPEVERTFQLFLETWREGKAKMALAEDALSTNLPGECQANEDPYTGADYPDEARIVEDDNYTIRAWMAVTTYLLTDYQFLYE